MQARAPTVSVIIPTYNRAYLVGRAIRSVLNQTFQDFEIIVVDDGSTDNTEEVVKSFNDPRIRYIRHEQNRGGSAARNTGIRAARGEYIAFLDSDDEWLPQKLERQVNAFKSLDETTGLVYTGLRFVDHKGTLLWEQRPNLSGYIFHKLLQRNVIGTASSVMLRRDCLLSTGLFDETLPSRQDLDLWIRIARQFKVFPIPEPLTVHYVHEQRITADLNAKIRGHKLFMAKFENELNSKPRALAWQLYGLGKLYLQKGEIAPAKSLFWKSLKKWPYPRVILDWLLLVSGTYSFARRLRSFFKERIGLNRDRNRQMPAKDKKPRLALFFTLGVSLRNWNEMGHLCREAQIYKRLASRFGVIYFLTYGEGDRAFEDTLAPIKVLPKPPCIPPKLYSFLMPFVHWKTLRNVDILKTNQMNGAWTAVLAKILFRKKLVVRCGYEWEMFAKRAGTSRLKLALIHIIEWICYRSADAIIVTSQEAKQYVSKTFGIPSGKIVVIPNYIDTELFRPLNIEKIANRLIFVGRFTEQKNLLNLLMAMKDIPYAELVLVGDGPLESALREFAQKHSIKATFAGRLPNDELPVLLNSAEAFVLPSLYEGNPKALLEAMACGLPVIVTPVEGNREVVNHRVNGYLTNGTSAEAIKEAIIEVLSDEKFRKQLGERARSFIEENYSIDVLLQQELRMLASLLMD